MSVDHGTRVGQGDGVAGRAAMAPLSRSSRSAKSLLVVGEWVLVLLTIAWAVVERPAPIVNIHWRDGVTDEARLRAERELQLFKGERTEDAWQYEVASPRGSDIAAIVRHADVQDTNHIERATNRISADAGRGTVRVWWSGPFVGIRGRQLFRGVWFGLGAALVAMAMRGTLLRRGRTAEESRDARLA